VQHFQQRTAAVFVVQLAAYRYQPLDFLNQRRAHLATTTVLVRIPGARIHPPRVGRKQQLGPGEHHETATVHEHNLHNIIQSVNRPPVVPRVGNGHDTARGQPARPPQAVGNFGTHSEQVTQCRLGGTVRVNAALPAADRRLCRAQAPCL
jgi:hypothetical protein